ncbi:hypothetical protein Hdeb2414_s0095g00791781 [Helianthus debilis subsp. tardiflorus]
MAKILEPDGYSRNPTQMGRVYPIPDGYWAGYGSGMRLGDTRPDYPKPHTRLPELYTRSYTRTF